MNLNVFSLNDGILYAMSSAIFTLKSIEYTRYKRYPEYYTIDFLTKVGEMRFYKNDIIVEKAFPIVYRNKLTSGLSLIFAYECAKKEAFVWL